MGRARPGAPASHSEEPGGRALAMEHNGRRLWPATTMCIRATSWQRPDRIPLAELAAERTCGNSANKKRSRLTRPSAAKWRGPLSPATATARSTASPGAKTAKPGPSYSAKALPVSSLIPRPRCGRWAEALPDGPARLRTSCDEVKIPEPKGLTPFSERGRCVSRLIAIDAQLAGPFSARTRRA